jgi:MinD-like ATPase involved in chromosome partitioning or flagellar assembly
VTEENDLATFDKSLPRLVDALLASFSIDAIKTGWFLINASGQLTFIAAQVPESTAVIQARERAVVALGAYLNPDFGIVSVEEAGISSIVHRASYYTVSVKVHGTFVDVRLIDQRLVGRDWLSAPSTTPVGGIPSIVFASLKGGVGRTTALAVVAAHLALRGRKVLVVDLDLEAPGIGAMLLAENELPRFGMLDAFVESGVMKVSDDFLLDMVSASSFGAGRGLIDVAPAIGSIADCYPENVLAKLARAYVDGFDDEGNAISFGERARQIITRLAGLKTYDLILVDARAGLNESTAAALLGLGANILLFGEDTPQTFADYRYLLAHLARFNRDQDNDWVTKLKMVQAKASPEAGDQQRFRDRIHDVFREFLYVDRPVGPVASPDELLDAVLLPEFALDDPGAPHHALPVLMDPNYFRFDPRSRPKVLDEVLYRHTYAELLLWVGELIEAVDEEVSDAG